MAEPTSPLRPWSLRDVVVCAHYGSTFVNDVVDRSGVLSDAERAAFQRVDPRAFRADAERAHRAVVAIADELPVTIAVAGLDAVYALFHREDAFGAVVRGDVAMAVVFAAHLEAVAGDVARIEGAMATARRRGRGHHQLALAAGVDVVAVDNDDVIDAYAAVRASLGVDATAAAAAVCAGARRSWPAASTAPGPAPSPAWILVTGAQGAAALSRCSAALGALLAAVGGGVDVDGAVAAARSLGCDDDDEALALVDELVGDGLIVRTTDM